jgi:DNA-binding transcriptional LysR family regulator
MQMRRLEDGVGVPLFIRNGRTMALTPEGSTLLGYARRILKLHDEAIAAIVRPEMSGRVRLGAPDDLSDHLLPGVLTRFSNVYPQVQVDVSCDPSHRLMDALENGELDLVVRINGEVPQHGQTIFYEQVVWVTSTHHLAHEKSPLPIAVYNEECIYREWAIRTLDAGDREYRIAYTSPSTSGILAAVRAGLAVAPVGISTLSDGLRILGPDDGFPELPPAVVSLVKARGPQSRAVESLAEHIVDQFKQLSLNRKNSLPH